MTANLVVANTEDAFSFTYLNAFTAYTSTNYNPAIYHLNNVVTFNDPHAVYNAPAANTN